MARIRSTHPEQWCDDDFVELSMAARLLCIGIRNFCDDNGIFEWKPKKLKMQVFPADNVDCEELISELVGNRFVTSFEVGGKRFGAVRNFCRYQRPKKPNSVHPTTPEILAFVGKEPDAPESDAKENLAETPSSSPPVPHSSGTSSENQFQMEKEKEKEEEIKSDFAEFWEVWGRLGGKVARSEAERAWKSLSQPDRRRAIDRAPGWFSGWRKANPRANNIHASRYLKNRRWLDEAAATGPPRQVSVFGPEGPEHR